MNEITLELTPSQAELLLRTLNSYKVELSLDNLRDIAAGTKMHQLLLIADLLAFKLRVGPMNDSSNRVTAPTAPTEQ